MARGGARPGAGRPRKVPEITNGKRQEMLEEHLGPDWKAITSGMGAKATLYLCKTLALHNGDTTEAAKIATALLPFEEAKPLAEQRVTVNAVAQLTDAELGAALARLEHHVQDAEFVTIMDDANGEE